MFQKSRPELSNRFQSRSSRTSARSKATPSITLRTPLSKAGCNVVTEFVRQQAHSGAGPVSECGRSTLALVVAVRSGKNIFQSCVKIGMSQLTTKFHSQLGSFFCE